MGRSSGYPRNMRNGAKESQPGAPPEGRFAPPCDGIVVIFGAAVRPDGQPSLTLRHRVEAAIGLGRRLAAPLFIPTGAQGRFGAAEAVVMARLLTDAGFPERCILREETGTDTVSSVRAVRRMLRSLPPAPVFACTSAYHLPRCRVLMYLAGVPARACPPPAAPASRTLAKRWFWRLREVPALPLDAATMLWLRGTGRLR